MSARLSGGDDGYDRAYQELFLPAMRLAYKILGDRHTAEDIAAEAMARAFASWRKIRDLPHRDAWVLRVVTNLAIDHTRKRKAPLGSDRHDEFEEVATIRLALVAALRALPTRQRDAIALYYLSGMSESAVSSALGISTSSVRTHVQRGLAALRTQLGRDPGEAENGVI